MEQKKTSFVELPTPTESVNTYNSQTAILDNETVATIHFPSGISVELKQSVPDSLIRTLVEASTYVKWCNRIQKNLPCGGIILSFLFFSTIIVYIPSKLRIIIILFHKVWLILLHYPAIQLFRIYQHYCFPLLLSAFLSMEKRIDYDKLVIIVIM